MTTSNIAAEQIEEEENKKFKTLFPDGEQDSEENYKKCLRLRNIFLFKEFLKNKENYNGNKIIFLCQHLSEDDIDALGDLTDSDNLTKVYERLDLLCSFEVQEVCQKNITTFNELKNIDDLDKIRLLTTGTFQSLCEEKYATFTELKEYNLTALEKLRARLNKINAIRMIEDKFCTVIDLMTCDDDKFDLLSTHEAVSAYMLGGSKFSELKKLTIEQIEEVLKLSGKEEKEAYIAEVKNRDKLPAPTWVYTDRKGNKIDGGKSDFNTAIIMQKK